MFPRISKNQWKGDRTYEIISAINGFKEDDGTTRKLWDNYIHNTRYHCMAVFLL